MRSIIRFHDWLLNALKACSMVVIFGIFALIVIDVGVSIIVEIKAFFEWTEPEVYPWDMTHGLVEYGMLWFTMLAAPWLARVKGHVFIDAVTELLSPKVQRYTAKLAYFVALVGSVVFAYFSVLLLHEAYIDEMIDERGAELYLWTLYLPMPIGFALVAIEFLRYLVGVDDMYGKRSDVREGM